MAGRALLAALVLMLVGPAASHASITVASPAASTRYGDPLAVNYTISEAPSAFDTAITFDDGVGTTYVRFLDNSAIGANARSVSVPDGAYTVAMRYSPSGGGPLVESDPITNVRVDTVTQAPTLTAPAASSVSGAPIAVSLTLPEAATPGSARLSFIPAVGSPVLLTLADVTDGAQSWNLPVTGLGANANLTSASASTLPDGTYDVQLSYQDVYGNPAASSFRPGVTIDGATQVPSLTSPAAGSTHAGATVPVSFSLAETALAGSTSVVFSGPTTRTIALSRTATGSATVTLDRANLNASAGVTSVLGGATLPDGLYTVTLQTRDAVGNTAAQVSAANVRLGVASAEQPPTSTPDQPSTPTTTVPTPTVSQKTPGRPPAAPKRLAAAWSTVKVGGRLVLRARFRPVAGARTYALTAAKGKAVRRGTCRSQGRGAARRVTCDVTIRRAGVTGRAGRWTATVRANAGATVLARATRRTR